MITLSMLKQPVMVDKVLISLVEAYAGAMQKSGPNGGSGHGKSYITDPDNGDNNIMRLDVFLPDTLDQFPNGGVIVYGDNSQRITALVEEAVGHNLYSLL